MSFFGSLTDARFAEDQVGGHKFDAGQAVHVDGELQGLEGRWYSWFVFAFKKELLASRQS